MQLKDWLAVAALAVSLLTAFFTAYQQYWKRTRLILMLGNHVSFAYSQTNQLRVFSDLTLLNEGARYAVVVNITGTLRATDRQWEAPIYWRAFFESTNIGKPGKALEPWFSFAGWAAPIAIPNRQAVVRSIVLLSKPGVKVLAGKYSIELEAVTSSKRDRQIYRHSTLRIEPDQVVYLEKKCKSDAHDGVSKHSLGVHLDHRPA